MKKTTKALIKIIAGIFVALFIGYFIFTGVNL